MDIAVDSSWRLLQQRIAIAAGVYFHFISLINSMDLALAGLDSVCRTSAAATTMRNTNTWPQHDVHMKLQQKQKNLNKAKIKSLINHPSYLQNKWNYFHWKYTHTHKLHTEYGSLLYGYLAGLSCTRSLTHSYRPIHRRSHRCSRAHSRMHTKGYAIRKTFYFNWQSLKLRHEVAGK